MQNVEVFQIIMYKTIKEPDTLKFVFKQYKIWFEYKFGNLKSEISLSCN